MIDVAIKRIGNRPILFMHFHFSLKSPISSQCIQMYMLCLSKDDAEL